MSPFNPDGLENDWIKWRKEWPSSSCFTEPQPDLWGCTRSGSQRGQTQFFVWMNWAKWFTNFCLRRIRFFCIFHNAIYWMKLERFFSMLAPTQSQHCLLLSSQSKNWGISTYAGTSGYFFFCVCLSHHCCQQSWTLPQSSLGYFFFCIFTITCSFFCFLFFFWSCKSGYLPSGVDSRLMCRSHF